VAVLALLAIDGVLCAVAAAFFLPLRLGATPFPVSALIAGLVNAALVWAALHWTTSPRVAALPLWTWLLTVALMTLRGPGGDIIFGDSPAPSPPSVEPEVILAYANAGVVTQYAPFLLIVLGVVPPVLVLWRCGSGGE
jgi:hypothetical protein